MMLPRMTWRHQGPPGRRAAAAASSGPAWHLASKDAQTNTPCTRHCPRRCCLAIEASPSPLASLSSPLPPCATLHSTAFLRAPCSSPPPLISRPLLGSSVFFQAWFGCCGSLAWLLSRLAVFWDPLPPPCFSLFVPSDAKSAGVSFAFSQVCRNMGCIFSTEAVDDGGRLEIPVQAGEIYLWVPGFREPKQIDLTELLKGTVSPGLAARLQSLRSQIIAVSGRNGPVMKIRPRRKSLDDNSGEPDLEKALNDYLPVLLGLVTGGDKFCSAVEFPWTNVVDENKETALASGYYELLSVLHLLGILAIQEANLCLTPRPPADGNNPKAIEGMCFALHPVFAFGRYISASLSWNSVSDENKRNAIEILLKAASYFECAIKAVLPNAPNDIKARLPADLKETMLRSLELQALGQAVELQLGFAIGNIKASLAVKRRLACEQVEVWDEAVQKLASVPLAESLRDKQLLFVKWKFAEAKATAYYFHGLILDEGYEDNTHAEALSCLKAAHAYLKESEKARTEFGNMEPLTKVPPLWGPVKYLAQRVPRETLSKGRIFRDNYSREKMPGTTPKLPEFPIALEADPFHLPAVDAAWKKERGYEAKPSLTADVPAFLARKNSAQTRPPASDLRRAPPMAPPPLIASDMVRAR